MTITTDDVRTFATNAKMRTFTNLFDEWLESHDAEVRNEAIIARDTRTSAELIEAAWDAAYPVPPNGRIPKGTKYLTRCGGKDVVTAEAGIDLRGGQDIRTLEPLPPLIPDDCKEVRASSYEDPLRSVWIRDARAVDAWVAVTVLGEVMRAHTNDLIDPKPVPKEER
jgi:hypothetical protein